jgi:hypothetical protein
LQSEVCRRFIAWQKVVTQVAGSTDRLNAKHLASDRVVAAGGLGGGPAQPSALSGPLRQALALGALDLATLLLRAGAILLLLSPMLLGALLLLG